MAINVLLLVVAPLITIMSIFQFTHGNSEQGLVDFLFALISIFGLFWIRGSKDRINTAANVGSFLSLFLTVALFILVPEDTLRIGWFLVLLVLTFFLACLRIGLTISALTIIFLWTMYCTNRTNYSGYELFYFSTLALMLTILLSFYEYRGAKNRLRLQSMNSELEEQVQARTAELARANKKLQLFFYALDTSSNLVIISDMDGRKTYEQILFLHPSQKAVISSGFSETEEVKKTQALGAAGFIKNPYSMDQLGTAVQQGLAAPYRASS